MRTDKQTMYMTLEKLGFIIEEAKGFAKFLLPNGWTKKWGKIRNVGASNIELLDPKARVRADLRFSAKTQGYTRIYVMTKYEITSLDQDKEGSVHSAVVDNETGEIVFSSEPKQVQTAYYDPVTERIFTKFDPSIPGLLEIPLDEDYASKRDEATNESVWFLNTIYPDWQNPLAYW